MRLSAGTPYRLGATWDGRGTNFALFSANAWKVELCLFDNQGRREIERIALPERTEDVWHGYLPDVSPGQLYGYRVHGPYDPDFGHRFNPPEHQSKANHPAGQSQSGHCERGGTFRNHSHRGAGLSVAEDQAGAINFIFGKWVR